LVRDAVKLAPGAHVAVVGCVGVEPEGAVRRRVGWDFRRGNRRGFGGEVPVLQHAGLDCRVGKELLEGGQCVAVADAERQHLSKLSQ
jgi:hypothetical protein